MINAISYVLIAFVSVSLVVSSIMIAIITYISVLERTKEIGILRSLGASKKNVRNVFNAETLIEGLCAGLLGVGVTLLLCLIANPIIHHLTGISSINAYLHPVAAPDPHPHQHPAHHGGRSDPRPHGEQAGSGGCSAHRIIPFRLPAVSLKMRHRPSKGALALSFSRFEPFRKPQPEKGKTKKEV